MKKNYSINSQIAFSLLLFFSFNFSVLAQSRESGDRTESRHTDVSRIVAARNVSRNAPTRPIVQSNDVITACGSYTWPANGQTYTSSGTYTAGGGITQIFNNQTAWNNSAAGTGASVSTNNMSGLTPTDPIVVVIGGTTVSIHAANGAMYSNGTFIGTGDPNQDIEISFSPAIYGISGNYFTTNVADAVISGNVTATYSTGTVDSRTVTTNTECFGYFSVTPITKVTLHTITTVPNHFISLNNLSIATNPSGSDTLDLTINPQVIPTFPGVSPICNGTPLAPLPTTSDNGITGSWSPALDNTTTTTYTFTPDIGQCATTKTIPIRVYPIVANTSTVTACTSYTWPINGVTYTTSGIHSALIPITDTAIIDDVPTWMTHASSFNSTIYYDSLVNIPATNPTVIPMGPVTVKIAASLGMYSGGTFLGTTHPNNPLTITFNPPVYGVLADYFTSDSDDNTISGDITVNYSNGTSQTRTVTTNSDSFGYFDYNLISSIVISSSTPDTFMSVSNLRIAADPTSCSTETLDLTINTTPPAGDTIATAIDVHTPNYTTVGNNLETNCFTDTNSATGGELSPDVWYKVTLDGCAQTMSVNTCSGTDFDTIITVYKADGTTELGYSDDDCSPTTFQSSLSNINVSNENVVYVMVEGYYGLGNEQGTYGLEITQTLLPQTVTHFNPVASICNGDTLAALPTTSLEGIPGSWAPALDNTTTTTYTFTPNSDQCATTASLVITVNQPVTPTFNAVADICRGGSLSALPTTSNNGFTGNWSPALDNTVTTVYTFTPTPGQCAATASLTITVNQPVTPTFNAVADICNGDSLTALPTTSLNGYTGTWSPALDNTITKTYTFTPTAGQCATTASLIITVNQPITPTFAAVTPICNGDSISALPTTSVNGYTGTWSPALDNTITKTYTFTPTAGQCATTASLIITVNQPVTPTFAAVTPICNGDTLTALPTTSVNGYTGSWLPALDNTATTTYTFTPDPGQCANTASLIITVNQPVTPTFNAVADICNGDTLAALPTTSVNGYVGSWLPALDNTVTTTYTFTPNPGQCANTASLTITVNQPVTPTFNAVADICNGDSLTALPTTSLNGFTGLWSPALDNTITKTYTFTPTAGQCATTASLTITVNQPITPTFNAVADICNGDSLTALPTTSLNGFTGLWSPALDNTITKTYTFTPTAGQCATIASLTITVNQPITPTFAAVTPICNGDTLTALPTTSINGYTGSWLPALDNTVTTTYTFTPDPGQCAATDSLIITVNQPVVPTFTAVAPICNGDSLSALPTTSNDGYTGSWSPALDNTSTKIYTFTPDAGQCAANASLTITVNQPVTPTFNAIAPICNGDTLVLPTTSLNGYTGSWLPIFDNTTTTVYTFTPDPGQCALTASLTITVNQPVTPTFNAVADICNGDSLTALPTTSINGYTGSWSPALDNTITKTYTFTPTAGQCATTASLTITVNQPVTPTFNAVADICNGDSLIALPTTSINGYTGLWSPALDNTITKTYTFTPTAGQCATTASLTITVNQPITPTFAAVTPICNGDPLSALPTTSINGYTGSWLPALDNTNTTTYTFTPDSGQCASTASLIITVNQPVTPTFTAVAPICNGGSLSALPTTSNNGYTGSWSPALDNTNTTTYTFTPDPGQCAATASLIITVNQPTTVPTFTAIAPICNGSTFVLPTTSNNAITGTWSPVIDNTATTTYLFTPDPGQCGLTTTLEVVVNQPVTPTFDPIAAICSGDSLVLPTTSVNGISGTWSPAIDNTTTTTYSFTPNVGECATSTTTLQVVVNQQVTPTFDPIAAICNGDSLTLPTTSVNGYTGSWSPALDNTITKTYTFTPNAGQCATTASLTITVNQPITPTFAAVASICNGETLTALPTTSINGYTGSWLPALDNTATTTYTFTPDSGQCASAASLIITVNQPVTPTFTAVAPICNGETLTALPTTSINGYTGSWSPALDNTNTTTYTFTPDPGQCAATASLIITVNQPTTVPTFTAIAPICNGSTFVLPTTSNNGISGSWLPALDNTTTTTYTFTPDPGQCGITTTLEVVVNQPVTPTFDPIAAICSGDSLVLPTTSVNGISGTWSPAIDNTTTTTYSFTPNVGECATSTTTLQVVVNQQVTPTFDPIAAICNGDSLTLPTTSVNGYTGSWSPALDNTITKTYTFTPNAGQCATTASLTITVNQPITPTFATVASICNGETLTALPTTSINGYTGSWLPALDNTATTTYTFTPDSGQCASAASLIITVNQPVTPTFTAVAPICNGETLTALPTTSINGYTGSWSPALDNTNTTTYTFTPDPGQCAATASLIITVNQPTTVPTFTAIAPICNGSTFVLPTTSNNGISGSWLPALDNTTTTTYTFTPDPGQCGITTTLEVTVTTATTPTGNATQIFDVTDSNNATIADLVVSPTNVIWYASLADAQSASNPLASTTVLTTGNTYYAVNVIGSCSSQPFAVLVTVNLGNPGFDDLTFNYYPNPTASIVNISCSQNITRVTLVDMLGQVISTQETNSTEVQVDLSRLAEATYFVKVASDDREKVIKVIKKR